MIERTAVLANDRPPAAVEAHFIFDLRTGAISFLDAAAGELFGVREAATTQRRATELVPELDDPTPRSFAADVATAFGIRTLELDVARLSGGDEEAILVVVRSARPAEAAAKPVPRPSSVREERLESLWSLVVRRGVAGGDQVRTILREAIVGLGLDVASVARIDGAELVVLFATREEEVGTRLPVARSAARSAIAGAGTYAVLDAQREPGALAGATALRCSLTTAFRAGEERYVATFSSRAPRDEPFADADWRYAEDVTEALARAIERLASDERFERLAYSDALTSLPNRFALLAKLDAALAETDRVGGRTAVFFLDVDGFKGVNDTVGHRGGDAVLSEIAARLRSTLRREEYVGRLGGDEFAVIVPQVGETAELEKIAQRITSELTFPFQYDGYRFSLSASIGVAIYPDDARDRDTLLAMADDAMYAVKDGVRGRDSVGSGVVALAKRPDEQSLEHEYVLFYQPILDVDRDEIASVEALVRRIDPEHGLLAPERGWTIARDVAGRRELDRFVLTAAARQARAWHRAGLALRVDVNLAAYDTAALDALLADETLASDVRRLRIEVDAALLARGDDALAAFVAHGAANGLGFTLDGFDGALAMLPQLGELPIETVKLGRAIVDGALENPALLAVVQGTAIVARSLDWRVVAKGVETLEQQRALTALGCDAIQGYVVARPMAASEITAWLRDRVPAERRA